MNKSTWKTIGWAAAVFVVLAIVREVLARRGVDPIARIGSIGEGSMGTADEEA